MPIIFVLTKSYNEDEYSKMVNYLKNLGIKYIIPVLSKNYKIVLKDQSINIPPKNLKSLVKLSFDKCKNSGYPSFKKSLNEQIFYNILKNCSGINNGINNSLQSLNLAKNKNSENNIQATITNILSQIICQYLGIKNDNEINSIINQNIDDFIQSLFENEEIDNIIKYYISDIQNLYDKNKDIILAKYNVNINEINYSFNNNINKKIEEMVILKILVILSNKIYTEFNIAIMNFISEEIKIRKKIKTSVVIPFSVIKEIQRISDNIYINLENICDDEQEDKDKGKKIKENNYNKYSK